MTHGPHHAIPRLHVLTGEGSPDDVLAIVEAALAGGAPCIQVRTKSLPDRERYALACAVVVRCRVAGAACIVDDRVDIALASGADGVHVGADDLPVTAVREVVGDRLLVGATARDAQAGRWLAAAGADYLGVGPVYATASKDGLPDWFGPVGLADVAAAVDVAVIAISGITVARVGEVLAAGAHGVAVLDAVAGAADPVAATRQLVDRLGVPVGAGQGQT